MAAWAARSAVRVSNALHTGAAGPCACGSPCSDSRWLPGILHWPNRNPEDLQCQDWHAGACASASNASFTRLCCLPCMLFLAVAHEEYESQDAWPQMKAAELGDVWLRRCVLRSSQTCPAPPWRCFQYPLAAHQHTPPSCVAPMTTRCPFTLPASNMHALFVQVVSKIVGHPSESCCCVYMTCAG